MGRRKEEPICYTRTQVIFIVLGAALIQRYLTVACAKGAAFYAARGDERMASRFSRAARYFARMSYMYGELEQETEVPRKG